MATIFTETFEAATEGPGQTMLGAFEFVSGASESFTDGAGDFLTVTDGAGEVGGFVAYANASGRFLAAMDLDGEGATLPIVLQASGIDITGFQNLMLSLAAAEDDDPGSEDWDVSDVVHVAVQIDGGGFTDIVNFESIPDGGDFNAVPAQDADFDGDGDPGAELTDSFESFTGAIAGTGASLDIRITLDLNSGDEDIALDDITLSGDMGGAQPILLNELLVSTTGADSEFAEIIGAPGASLDGLSLVNIEADSGGNGVGGIDSRLDFGPGDRIGDNGVFLVANSAAAALAAPNATLPDNFFENGDSTIALVETASLTGDTVDGTETAIDAVALQENGGTFFYDAPVVGPDGSFYPSAAGRMPHGGDWMLIDAFSPAGANTTPTAGTGLTGPFVDRFIHEIQGATDLADEARIGRPGDADESPLLGEAVRVEGIVTQVLPGLGGFFLQEEDADADADPATSEGVFVSDPAGAAVAEGDLVTVEGTVAEVEGETRIAASTTAVGSQGNPLPAAVEIAFPTANVLIDADGDFVADLEPYEGMRVTIPEEMTITEFFQLDRFGTYRVSSEGRLEQFTQSNAPDVAGFTQHRIDNAKRQIVIDDGQDVQNPDTLFILDNDNNRLDAGDEIRMGDSYTGLTGVIAYGEDDQDGNEEPEFRLHTPDGTLRQNNPREAAPEDVGSDFTVTAFNVLNFFTTLDTFGVNEGIGPDAQDARGADTEPFRARGEPGETEEYDRQLSKLVEAITALGADIVGLVEIENDFLPGGASPDVADAQAPRGIAIQALVDALNAELGAEIYDWVDPGSEAVGGDAIATGFLYDTTSTGITPGSTVDVLTDADLAGLGLDFGNPVFDGDGTSRAPIAASFTEIASGESLTVTVNHFKSKGSISPFGDNTATGDGQGNNNETRVQAATALDTWLDSDPTGAGNADVMILGDLNAYAEEDPVTFLEGEGYTDLAGAFLGADRASFVFDAQKGTLDYALANQSLAAKVTGATEWTINSPEADAFDYNLDFNRDPALFDGTTPYRSSDHDPILVGLALTPDAAPVAVGDSVATPAGTAVTLDLLGNDLDEDVPGLALAGVGEAGNGTVEIVGGQALYTPSAGFEGIDSFRYTVEDAAGNADTGLAAVTVGTPDPVAGSEGVIRGTDRDDPILIGQNTIYLGGDGVDTFIVSAAAQPGTSVIEGAGDVLQFVGGVEVTSSLVLADALELTLSTGARLQVLQATEVSYDVGGNATTGETGTVLSYADFAGQVLGATVPGDGGLVEGRPVIVEDPADSMMA